MDKYQKIYDFLDGIGTEEDHKSLFDQLSSNPELASEFKKLIAIDSSVSSNNSFFQPSVDASNQLYEKLGFSNGLKTPFYLGFLNFLRNPKFISGLVGSFATIIILWSYFTFWGNNGGSKSDNLINGSFISKSSNFNENLPTSSLNVSNKKFDGSGNYETKSVSGNKNSPKEIINYINNNKYLFYENGSLKEFNDLNNLNEYINAKNINTDKSKIFDISDSKYSKPYGKGLDIRNSTLRLKSIDLVSNDFQYESINYLPKDLEFHFLSNLGERPGNGLEANSLSGKITYLPIKTSNYKFGFELAKENFLQNFERQIENERTEFFTQNPSLITIGLGARAYLFNFNETVHPYLQLFAGTAFTNEFNLYSGYFGRIAMGTEIESKYLPFNTNIGLQYTNLGTLYDNNVFNANTISFLIGVSF